MVAASGKNEKDQKGTEMKKGSEKKVQASAHGPRRPEGRCVRTGCAVPKPGRSVDLYMAQSPLFAEECNSMNPT